LTIHFGAQRVHSAKLYQLFADINNIAAVEAPGTTVEGMLLFPVVNNSIRLDYHIHGHSVRIDTVDLAKPWLDIRNELNELLAST